MESIVKIVYQNGDFITRNSSILGISVDTIFTVLTTIGIFITGFIINKWIEASKEKKRLKELEEYFKKLVEIMNTPLEKKNKSMVDFSNTLNEKKDQPFTIEKISNFVIYQILEIDNKDLYKVFIKNKKSKDTSGKTKQYMIIKGSLSFLKEIEQQIEKDFQNFINLHSKYEKEFKENIKISWEAFDKMYLDNVQGNTNISTDEFFISLDRIRISFIHLEKEEIDITDSYIIEKHYVNQVHELCRKFMNDSRAIFLLKQMTNCKTAFANTNNIKNIYRDLYLLNSHKIKKAYNDLTTALIQLDNL